MTKKKLRATYHIVGQWAHGIESGLMRSIWTEKEESAEGWLESPEWVAAVEKQLQDEGEFTEFVVVYWKRYP
jgi:hypothetical protein